MADKNDTTVTGRDDLLGLLSRARELEHDLSLMRADLSNLEGQRFTQAAQRLTNSVIRPLGDALLRMPVSSSAQPNGGAEAGAAPIGASSRPVDQSSAAPLGERLWQLAKRATTLRVQPGMPAEVQEATAALQDLACLFAPAEGTSSAAAKLAELKALQHQLPRGIQAQVNGPYLVTNADTIRNWLGERIPSWPQMALCRCGGSKIKPFCDGTHIQINFTDHKDPKRVRDQQDTYVGQQLTVLDNRGTCAHSGFCTDRLSSVFHLGKEPFVSPSGARLDDIIRAVRACPSGALSYALDGHQAIDQERQPAIDIAKDGPYRITGAIPLTDGQGNIEPRNEGASREHYSLCRCGHSQNKPFCSGMHWYVNFRDPRPSADHEPTLFEWAGGLPALTRMTRIFYSKYVPEDPLIGPLFANMSPDHPERVAVWLGEVFGGPKTYSEQYGGYVRMLSQHIGKGLTEEQRARWVSLLCKSVDEAGLPADAEFRASFVAYIEWGSRLALENSQPGAKPLPQMPMPRWWWACNATPGSRVSALAQPEEEQPVEQPSANDQVSFARHIKPLFRKMDRQSMTFAFDLWSYSDVTRHAQSILQRLQLGTMPCDGAWPKEKIETFRRWMESGMLE